MPNGEQSRKIKQFCVAVVLCLIGHWRANEQYQQDSRHKFSYSKIANLLPQGKKELSWLKECHSQVLQQSLKDLGTAFKTSFNNVQISKIQEKGVKESCQRLQVRTEQ